VTQTWNFAVIGCGALARQQHIPNIAANPRAVLHTCCDLDDAALADCRNRFGARHVTTDYQAAIASSEVNIVCIATTEKLRLPLIRACAEAGKPVYVEKPIAPTLDEAYEIQKVVHQSGIRFCAGHNRRCSPAMIEARHIFRRHMEHPQPCLWRWEREGDRRPAIEADGVAAMAVRINDDWHSWKGWVFDRRQARYGPMLFEMTHFTDLCNWFLAAQPAQVVALEPNTFNHGVVITYHTGELATIHMSSNGTFGYPKELYEMTGQGGLVAVDHMVEVRTAGIAGAPERITYPVRNDRHPEIGKEGGISGWLAKKRAACGEAAAAGNAMLQFAAEPDKGHAHALDRFLDEIEGRGPAVCGIDDAVLATRVAFAAIMAAHEKRAVSMTEV
jgi:predicted dehydrogenase